MGFDFSTFGTNAAVQLSVSRIPPIIREDFHHLNQQLLRFELIAFRLVPQFVVFLGTHIIAICGRPEVDVGVISGGSSMHRISTYQVLIFQYASSSSLRENRVQHICNGGGKRYN